MKSIMVAAENDLAKAKANGLIKRVTQVLIHE